MGDVPLLPFDLFDVVLRILALDVDSFVDDVSLGDIDEETC